MQVKFQRHTKMHVEIPVKCLTLLKAGMSQQTLIKLLNIKYYDQVYRQVNRQQFLQVLCRDVNVHTNWSQILNYILVLVFYSQLTYCIIRHSIITTLGDRINTAIMHNVPTSLKITFHHQSASLLTYQLMVTIVSAHLSQPRYKKVVFPLLL